MTNVDEFGEHGAVSVAQDIVYEVFNPDFSVGVACDSSGMIAGVHLGDDVWANSDHWLSREILRVARLAYLKSQVGRRAELLAAGAAPYTADTLGLPTESDFQRKLRDEFGSDY
ncbi:hypothetical protein FEK35_13450 [Nocardia cyriacigeorgica]|uniref:Uncharacterized protein n=1 Tax=Nocardia cyriacigeorgica TaxID=135487 RepID=A0A5R8PET6_9NOCA|nr:hypothetical protein [Nocardia cyriacigeorgica]TLG10904.1 hypothetical protein FEK35_13450 [Nocardia cyriacigeorgica]